ncbi:MAG: hypothetical protein AAFY43_01970 [Pseudomonadota bacterium]
MATLNGREALSRLDRSISDVRKALASAIEDAERAQTRRAEVRDGQVEAYRALAGIRLDLAASLDVSELDALHLKARDLIDDHQAYIARSASALEAAADTLEALEEKRRSLNEDRASALDRYESKVATVEQALESDEAYGGLRAAAEHAATVAARAEQKLAVAKEDRNVKGEPYREDPLFSYLWKRGFRTPDYKAGPITRMLDHWVARLSDYDTAYLNYDRLTELPERLAEHLERVEAAEVDALEALEAAEKDALATAGAPKMQAEADRLQAEIEATDAEIFAAEERHRALADDHDAALAAEAGPAFQARRLLEDGLRAASFPNLRVLAAETLALNDDELIDRLVKLRAEEMSLDLEGKRSRELPARHKTDLMALESLRRKFKGARFDTAYARFKKSAIDRAIVDIIRGSGGVDSVFRTLSRSVRRQEPKASRGFGGRSRSDTLGLPVGVGDILWEIAKEAGRQSGGRGSPWGGGMSPPRRRTRRSSWPDIKIGGGGGGGGRRGGGGFKTGGGF